MHYFKIIAGTILITTLLSFSVQEKESSIQLTTSEKRELPDDLKPILKKACFDCHHSDAKNFIAKKKVNFATLNELTKVKKISTLKKIEKEIKEDKMPPKKYIKRNPDKKLTDEEKELIYNWITTELETPQ